MTDPRHLRKASMFGGNCIEVWCGARDSVLSHSERAEEVDCPACLATAWVQRAREARELEKRLADLAGGRR